MSDFYVEMHAIKKSFGGVHALKGVDLKVAKGSIHALMGENGAGKSTLMKILTGNYTADSGEIFIDGHPIRFKKVADSIKHGISMIYQELNLIPHMSIAENIYIGRERQKLDFINFQHMREKTQELLDYLNISLSPDTLVRDLNVAKMQLIEIAKAISFQSRVIIMDEPTSALTDTEIQSLFKTVDKLRNDGTTIIYISHKLDEVYHLCDSCTVMRDGEFIGSASLADLPMPKLIEMMVGRKIEDVFPPRRHLPQQKEVVLKVENLSRPGEFENISFELHKGEVLGFAGLVGSGRTEIVETISQIRRANTGRIYKDGAPLSIRSPEGAIKNGICLAPEDRKLSGLVLNIPIRDNIMITMIEKCLKKGFLSRYLVNKEINSSMEEFHVKAPDMNAAVKTLSGGNQQKVLLAKTLFSDPEILILDEPTRGIDIKTKSEIYHMISDLSEAGQSIIMVSSELPEILGLCDRIIVMHEGRITGTLDYQDATQESVMAYAMDVA